MLCASGGVACAGIHRGVSLEAFRKVAAGCLAEFLSRNILHIADFHSRIVRTGGSFVHGDFRKHFAGGKHDFYVFLFLWNFKSVAVVTDEADNQFVGCVDLVYLEIAVHVGNSSDTAVFPIDICTEKRLLVAIDNLEDGAANLGFAYCGYCYESN